MKFNHTAHKELWDWLAKNPKKDKGDWPGWMTNGGIYRSPWLCFARNFGVDNYRLSTYSCKACPIKWPGTVCGGDDGLFQKWENEENLEERIKLAKQIRDLPAKEGVECI